MEELRTVEGVAPGGVQHHCGRPRLQEERQVQAGRQPGRRLADVPPARRPVEDIAGLAFEQYSRWTGVPLREQVVKGNLAAGIVDGAIHFAASQLVAGALTGDGGSLVPTLVFLGAGLIALIVFTHIFRQLTAYHDAEMIKQGNVAASLGCAGLIVAIGMMVGYAVSGNFTGYGESFRSFGLMLLVNDVPASALMASDAPDRIPPILSRVNS